MASHIPLTRVRECPSAVERWRAALTDDDRSARLEALRRITWTMDADFDDPLIERTLGRPSAVRARRGDNGRAGQERYYPIADLSGATLVLRTEAGRFFSIHFRVEADGMTRLFSLDDFWRRVDRDERIRDAANED